MTREWKHHPDFKWFNHILVVIMRRRCWMNLRIHGMRNSEKLWHIFCINKIMFHTFLGGTSKKKKTITFNFPPHVSGHLNFHFFIISQHSNVTHSPTCLMNWYHNLRFHANCHPAISSYASDYNNCLWVCFKCCSKCLREIFVICSKKLWIEGLLMDLDFVRSERHLSRFYR